jgi:hypothetical protein
MIIENGLSILSEPAETSMDVRQAETPITDADKLLLPALTDAPPLIVNAERGKFPLPETAHKFLISQIKIGTRYRHDLGDIDGLAAEIADVGLLHPIVVRPDGLLIAGQRRLAACKKLGFTRVPVHVINLEGIARGEFAENAFRKKFLPTEVHAIWQALKPIERAASRERQKATRFGSGAGNCPHRARVGPATGLPRLPEFPAGASIKLPR